MSREKLRAAIDYLERHPIGGSYDDNIEMLVAAARAYACEWCEGLGYTIEERGWYDRKVACPHCAEFRRIADAGGVP